jgi:mycothiol synthase
LKILSRTARDEADFDRVRDLLIQIYDLTRKPFCWGIERWDYWRFYVRQFVTDQPWMHDVQLWETADGDLIAAANPESHQDIHLQIHPAYREQLESVMLDWAEDHRQAGCAEGVSCKLEVWVYDDIRRDLLRSRGYTAPGRCYGYKRQRPLNEPIDEPVLPEGYTIRSMAGDEDIPGRTLASAKANNLSRPASVEEFKKLQSAPMYRADLDLLVVAPDGTIAAFATVWFDAVNRIGYFEPVATHPDYQRRGLGKALMNTGLRKLKMLGATDAYLGAAAEGAAARLYESVGFHITYREDIWWKDLWAE